jgi:hypothetical protein
MAINQQQKAPHIRQQKQGWLYMALNLCSQERLFNNQAAARVVSQTSPKRTQTPSS